MERYIQELKSKSCEVDIFGEKHSLFYAWTIYDEARQEGMTIDAMALMDSSRVIGEITKLVYVAILSHRKVAAKLGVKVAPKAPTFEQVEAWILLNAVEATKAFNYINEQMRAAVSETIQQKKRVDENEPN